MQYQQANGNPTAKVVAATIAALVVPTLAVLLKQWVGDSLPANAGDLLDVLIQALVLGVITAAGTFAAGWAKRPAERDRIKPDPESPVVVEIGGNENRRV